MSAFRGARFLASLGHHSLKCNRLHQRRIVSLGITSLCQVTSKKRALLDTNALPVNKHDLSGVGILSPTLAALFSTEATTPAEGGSGEVSENEAEPGLVNKWHAPVDQYTRKVFTANDNKTVFIGGYNFNYTETYLKDLFMQFGEVNYVNIPQKRIYNETPHRSDQYRYAFVTFFHEESITKALLAEKITTPEENIVEIKQKTKTPREIEIKHTFLIDGLPDDINVNQVYDHFKSFGDVELVNLVLNLPSLEDSNIKHNIAFILLKQDSDLFLNQEHEIGNSKLTIKKVSEHSKRQRRDRSKKVLLEGLPNNITQDQISSYFESSGTVRFVSILTNKETGEPNGLGVVHFEDHSEARSATQELLHEIGGSSIKARALGYLNK